MHLLVCIKLYFTFTTKRNETEIKKDIKAYNTQIAPKEIFLFTNVSS